VLDRLGDSFDVVHAFGYVLRRPHHINSCQFVHAAWRRSSAHSYNVKKDLHGMYHWLFSVFNSHWERQVFAQSGMVVAASNKVRQDLVSSGITGKRIEVIHNAADSEKLQVPPPSRADFGLPQAVPLALFAGDLRTYRKNLDGVLKAISQLPLAHLAVVGETRGSPFPELASKLGIADRTHFMGFRRDLAAIMQVANVFVFPSRYEPFGMVVLEAMAAGLPVIVASSVGAAELVTPHSGVVIDSPDDGRSLVQGLSELLNNVPRAQAMGRVGQQIAKKHSFAAMVQAYSALYSEAMARHPLSGAVESFPSTRAAT